MKVTPAVGALLVTLVVVFIGVPISAEPVHGPNPVPPSAPPGDTSPAATDTTGNTSNASLGVAISSFMQATAADAETTVDSGLFAAKFNDSNASERPRLVNQRVATLQTRVTELQAERRALLNATGDDPVTVAERAKAARLAARAASLRQAINTTAVTAERADIPINKTTLDRLRQDARNVTRGPTMGIVPGLVASDGRGPPEASPGADQGQQAGHPDNRTANATNGQPDPTPRGDRGQQGQQGQSEGPNDSQNGNTTGGRPDPTPRGDGR